jgi:hypothetical protein
MKTCKHCGKEIVNGVNGCAMMDICFTCNGGYPHYAPARKQTITDSQYYDALDYSESKCMNDGE